MTTMSDKVIRIVRPPADVGPDYWARFHALRAEFHGEVGDSCGCGATAEMLGIGEHDAINAHLGKPVRDVENLRRTAEFYQRAVEAISIPVISAAQDVLAMAQAREMEVLADVAEMMKPFTPKDLDRIRRATGGRWPGMTPDQPVTPTPVPSPEPPPRPVIVRTDIPRATDPRWKAWRKVVTGLDRSKKGGYKYLGDWLPVGRAVELLSGSLILRYDEVGSARHHHPEVFLARVKPDGDWETIESIKGEDWAIDLQDATEKALKENGIAVAAQPFVFRAHRHSELSETAILLDISGQGEYVRERVAEPESFDTDSFRTIPQGDHRVIVGKRKGKDATESQSILHPRSEEMSLVADALERGIPVLDESQQVADEVLNTMVKLLQ